MYHQNTLKILSHQYIGMFAVYVFLYVLFAHRASTYVFSWDPECLWFVTNLIIAQICFMIENSQKWYILDQHWWLVCFPIFCVCFVLGSRMFVIYYKSKYTSDIFYDWKFLGIVYPGSALMTGIFFCILCIFCLSKEHPHMFFHIKILKSCILPEYFSCDKSHFSPSNLML